MKTTVCTYSEIPYTTREIARYLKAENYESVKDIVDLCLSECNNAFSYKVCYRIIPVKINESGAVLGEMETNSLDLAKNLSGCDSVVVFCATVGVGIDFLIRKYSDLSPLKSLVFQCIGADRVENLCNRFCAEISKKFGKTAPRFSPGFGDFKLSFQKEIFSLLNATKLIGVTLSEKLIMAPSKSVTAIMGIKNEL